VTSARLVSLVVLIFALSWTAAAQNQIDPCESVRTKLAGSEPADLTISEIAKNPSCYADQFIRLIGIYRVAFENSDLYDPDSKTARAWVEFETYSAALKRCSRGNLKILNRKNGGTFGFIALGIIRTMGRHGHMNAWDYQFEPICIDNVELISPSGNVFAAHDRMMQDKIVRWYKNEIRKLY
jgi:hypothetical protein